MRRSWLMFLCAVVVVSALTVGAGVGLRRSAPATTEWVAGTASFPTGTYKTFYGDWGDFGSVRFRGEGDYDFFRGATPDDMYFIGSGTFNSRGHTFTSTWDERCARDGYATTGTYSWAYTAGILTFRLQNDQCVGRVDALVSNWKRAPKRFTLIYG